MRDQGKFAAQMSQFGQNCNSPEPAAAAAFDGMTAASIGRSAHGRAREAVEQN